MKKSCKKEAVADSFLIFIVIGFCLVGLFDIYVHIKWWISWPTFFVTFGTFCSFAVLTFFSGFILHFPIKRRRLIDDDAQLLIILAESVFTGSRARFSSATTGIFAIAREGCLSGLQRGS